MPVFALNFYSVFIWAVLANCLPIKERNKSLVFLGIVFVQFTLLAWQREFTVGQDTLYYYNAFLRFSNISFGEALIDGWEPGYVMWNWIVSHLGFDFHAYLLFTGAFIYYSFCRFVYRYSSCAWLSVVIFIAFAYFFGSLHILRQYMAIGIVLFSYDFMLKRRLIPFAVLILIATTFHASAIVFIPTYFIVGLNFKRQITVPILLTAIPLIIAAGAYILPYLVFVDWYTETYINKDASGTGYNMLVVMGLIMMAGYLFKRSSLSKPEQLFYWVYFMAVLLQPFGTVVSMMARAILYWSVAVVIFIPLVISEIKDANMRLIAKVLIVFCCMAFYIFITGTEEGVKDYATYRLYSNRN